MIKIKVNTHSGDEHIIEVDTFNAEELTQKRNDPEVYAISIGNYSYSKIDLKNVIVIE